jgi:uncharacterized OB-fold protein
MSEEKVSIKDLLGLSDDDMRKPLPVATEWSQPFWEGARQHKLLLKKCSKCGNIDHPPYLFCTDCMAEEHEWIAASGRGTLYSYAINTFGVPFPFWDDMPYVLAIIDLDEGPRVISNIVECDLERLENQMKLEVVFDDVSPEVTLPKWKPAGKEA